MSSEVYFYWERMHKSLPNADQIFQRAQQEVAQIRATMDSPEFAAQVASLPSPSNGAEHFMDALCVKFLYSCLIDADRTSAARFDREVPFDVDEAPRRPWAELAAKLEAHLANFEPSQINDIRRAISERCLQAGAEPTGIFTLGVQTGGGKTLSSLRFAIRHAQQHGLDRIIYVLPFLSIIEQNADTVRRVLGPDVVIESHSNASVEEQKNDADYVDSAALTRSELVDNWSGQIIFTTMVGALESVFGAGTSNIRRMHNMAKAVLIFDEIQALPVRCIYMFNMLVRYLTERAGSSVVLCSATQPLLDRLEKAEYCLPKGRDILSQQFELLDRVRVVDERTEPGLTCSQIAERLCFERDQGHSVLCITNTKATARQIHRAIEGGETFYLSTDLCAAHRSSVIADIRVALDARRPVIVVSTQLVEAGVDLDFDRVVRLMAGMDSLVQAAGRCNRNGRLGVRGGIMSIVNCSEESLRGLSEIQHRANQCRRVFGERGCNIFDPSVLELYYTYYFFNCKEEMQYKIDTNSLVNLLGFNKSLIREYGYFVKDCPQEMKESLRRFNQSFGTVSEKFHVIDNVQTSILVPYGQQGQQLLLDIQAGIAPHILRKRMQKFVVNIYHDKLKRNTGQIQSINDLYYVSPTNYDPIYGLNFDDMELLLIN